MGRAGDQRGATLVALIALYFVIKWGVKNGIAAYFEEKSLRKNRGRNRLRRLPLGRTANDEDVCTLSAVPHRRILWYINIS